VITVTWLELHLATVHIFLGTYDEATACADRAIALARKLRLRELELLANGVHAGVAAGRGRRSEMEEALAGLAGSRVLGYGTEVWGWARGTCALMEEDHDRAMADFGAAAEADKAVPNIRPSGYRGIYLLLSTVRGVSGWAELNEFADAHISRVQLHRPFVGWTRAVLLAREGEHEEAGKAAAEAIAEAGTIPMAAYFARRLVAERALAEGWGEPIEWLRTAEEYFHGEQITRVAAACRALLRQAGAQVAQRRRGHDVIPDEVRRAGVTVREYEVLKLLADRLGDREIAEQLFLSPRTVEKHVASLRARTDQPDRAALVAYARHHLPRA
jgi:DNA-binding CsgD family transcriptional regulator